MAKQTIFFVVDSDRDADILRWYNGVESGKRSEALRDIIRAGLGNGAGPAPRPATMDDIRSLLQEIKLEIRTLSVKPVERPDELPDDVLGALDDMGI